MMVMVMEMVMVIAVVMLQVRCFNREWKPWRVHSDFVVVNYFNNYLFHGRKKYVRIMKVKHQSIMRMRMKMRMIKPMVRPKS